MGRQRAEVGEWHERLIRYAQLMEHQPPVNFINAMNDLYADLHDMYAFYEETAAPNAVMMSGGMRQANLTLNRGGATIGDGLHNTTRYGEKEENPDRKQSLGVGFRNWHPGPLGFQYLADVLGYAYNMHFLAALDVIEKEYFLTTATRDPKFSSTRKPLLGSDLGDPKVCNSTYCKVDTPPGSHLPPVSFSTPLG